MFRRTLRILTVGSTTILAGCVHQSSYQHSGYVPSPTGGLLAVLRHSTTGVPGPAPEYLPVADSDWLVLRELDSGRERKWRLSAIEGDSPRVRSIQWSPDGRQLAYVLDYVLIVLDVEEGVRKQLTDDHVAAFRWSGPDRLVYVSMPEYDGSNPSTMHSFVACEVRPDGTFIDELLRDEMTYQPDFCEKNRGGPLSWDGHLLMYTNTDGLCIADLREKRRVCVMLADVAFAPYLLRGHRPPITLDYWWNDQGDRCLIQRGNQAAALYDHGNGELLMIREELRPLFGELSARSRWPETSSRAWTPDGQHVALHGTASDLVVSSDLRSVTDVQRTLGSGYWDLVLAPTGDLVAVRTGAVWPETGGYGLYVSVMQTTESGAADFGPPVLIQEGFVNDCFWLPDGRRLAAISYGDMTIHDVGAVIPDDQRGDCPR